MEPPAPSIGINLLSTLQKSAHLSLLEERCCEIFRHFAGKRLAR
jgi:hypothetical protein